jgi:cytochrome c oxidase assembly factor CtaG
MSPWDAAVLLLLGILALLYVAGSRVLATRHSHVHWRERLFFWTGWLALVISVAPPLDAAAAHTLSAHMLQHELMMIIGGPLIAAGRPMIPALWALPAAVRAMPWWRVQPSVTVAAVLHAVAVWIWHAPVLYQAAVLNEGVHVVQHASFVLTAGLFWWTLIYGRYGRAAYGASALYVFVTMVHSGVLGAILALSGSPFYGLYVQRASAAGVDPTADQQVAGLYMWIPAGIVLTLAGLSFVFVWLHESGRSSVRSTDAA